MNTDQNPNFPQAPQQGYQNFQPPPQKKGMSTGLKVLLGFVGLFTLGLAGCVGIVAVVASSSVDDETAAESETGEDGLPFGSTPEEDATGDDVGSIENPYPFGTSHNREPGLLGAGWTVSIDEVRTVEDSKLFAPETEGTCLAIIGTATLDSLNDGEELTSNGFSFPQVKMVAEGKEQESGIASCEAEPLKAEGLTWILELELTPGTTIQWFEVFRPSTDGSYDFVAIENDVYAQK